MNQQSIPYSSDIPENQETGNLNKSPSSAEVTTEITSNALQIKTQLIDSQHLHLTKSLLPSVGALMSSRRPNLKKWSDAQGYPLTKFSDSELIEMMLGFHVEPKIMAYLMAEPDFSGYREISGINEILGTKFTKAQLFKLRMFMELSNRKNKNSAVGRKIQIRTSRDAYDHLKWMENLEVEEFYILPLNRANSSIFKEPMLISRGGINGTVVDPKVIANKLLLCQACGVVLAHNHPSGNPKPSEPDLKLTNRIKEGLRFLEISLLDHIIICNGTYYSFADEGML